MNRVFRLSKAAGQAWIDDGASSMGASIAYYTVFSIAPLLVIVIAVAGMVWGDDAVRGAVQGELAEMLGTDAATAVQKMLQGAQSTTSGTISGLIGVVVLIVGATTVFGELQKSLDSIWHAPESSKPSGIWALVRTRLLSFGLILALGFLLLVSLLMGAVVNAFAGWLAAWIPAADLLLLAINSVISISIEAVLFAMIFKFMPSVQIHWRDVWMGAFVTAVLLEIGKVGIGLYLGKSSTVDSYTAAGSIVVLLLWVYYAAQIFLFGAEFTRQFALEHGSHRDELPKAARTPSATANDLPAPAIAAIVDPIPAVPVSVPPRSISARAAVESVARAAASVDPVTMPVARPVTPEPTAASAGNLIDTGAPAAGTSKNAAAGIPFADSPTEPSSAVIVLETRPKREPVTPITTGVAERPRGQRARSRPGTESKDLAAVGVTMFLLRAARRSPSRLFRLVVAATAAGLVYRRASDASSAD